MRVSNGIPLGSSLLLPVDTVICVQTLKADPDGDGIGTFCVGEAAIQGSSKQSLFGVGARCSDPPYLWPHVASFNAYVTKPTIPETVPWCLGVETGEYSGSFLRRVEEERTCTDMGVWRMQQLYLPKYPSQSTVHICVMELNVTDPVYFMRSLGRPDGFVPCAASPAGDATWGAPVFANVIDPCEAGFAVDDALYTCDNIDECKTGANDCDVNANCMDTKGSFECACDKVGWEDTVPATAPADVPRGRTCRDVDECFLETDDCNTNAVCDNTQGSFACACNVGWRGNGVSCNLVDECLLPEDNNCSTNATCTENDPSAGFACECKAGFVGNGTVCANIDECDAVSGSNDCNLHAKCTDTPGSYVCECTTGWDGFGSNGTHCFDADECIRKPEFDPLAGTYTDKCISVGDQGRWTCLNKQKDIDCEYVCQNVPGQVPDCDDGSDEAPGFCALFNKLNGKSIHNCDVNANCTNTEGGFECDCNDGYEGEGSEGNCIDIDECALNAAAVAVSAVGADGDDGSGGGSGDDANANAEAVAPLCSAQATCVDLVGSYDCVCNTPNWVGENNAVCKDVDECNESAPSHNCDVHATCNNTLGGFDCICNPGWMFKDGGSVCEDVDECSRESDSVCNSNAICFDLNGTFACGRRETDGTQTFDVCNAGYTGDGITCENIDECEEAMTFGTVACQANAKCTDTNGSFACDCVSGYELNIKDDTCEDVHECDANPEICGDAAWLCVNTIGAFNCECPDGLYKPENGSKCEEILECTNGIAQCGEHYYCIETGRSYECVCLAGFTEKNVGTADAFCDNLDECINESNNCAEHAACTDTVGGFTCTCNIGYAGDGTVCENVDECVADVDVCHAQAACTDNAGGFACECNSGWFGSGINVDGGCANVNECISGGDLCGENQECMDETPVDGRPPFYCKCTTNFVAVTDIVERPEDTVCIDVNECENQLTRECCEGNAEQVGFGTCFNKNDGYLCKCRDGFATRTNSRCGEECVDVDECKKDPCSDPDRYACVNTPGSFECIKIKECGDVNDPSKKCRKGTKCNTVAGEQQYTCIDRNECENTDFDEDFSGHDCASDNGDHGPGTCVDMIDGYFCKCPDWNNAPNGPYTYNDCNEDNSCKGHTWDHEFQECLDGRNECENDAWNDCRSNTKCSNKDGSYTCECAAIEDWKSGGDGVCEREMVMWITLAVKNPGWNTTSFFELEEALRSSLYVPAVGFNNSVVLDLRFDPEVENKECFERNIVRVDLTLKDGRFGEALSERTLDLLKTLEQIKVEGMPQGLIITTSSNDTHMRPEATKISTASCTELLGASTSDKGASASISDLGLVGVVAAGIFILMLIFAVLCARGEDGNKDSVDLGSIGVGVDRPYTVHGDDPHQSQHIQMTSFGPLSQVSDNHEALLNVTESFSWMHGPHYGGVQNKLRAKEVLMQQNIENGAFLVFTNENPYNPDTRGPSYTLLYSNRGEIVEDKIENNKAGRLTFNGAEVGSWKQINHFIAAIMHGPWFDCRIGVARGYCRIARLPSVHSTEGDRVHGQCSTLLLDRTAWCWLEAQHVCDPIARPLGCPFSCRCTSHPVLASQH
jgi:hypothetical protein